MSNLRFSVASKNGRHYILDKVHYDREPGDRLLLSTATRSSAQEVCLILNTYSSLDKTITRPARLAIQEQMNNE